MRTPLHVLSKQNLLPDLPNAPKYKAQQKRNYQFDRQQHDFSPRPLQKPPSSHGGSYRTKTIAGDEDQRGLCS